MSTYLIKGASLLGERVADILIEDGKIARIGQDIEAADAQVVDASGQIALPGLVDIHTHLRQPGYEASETVETGTRAAALGGYTAVFAMANSLPVASKSKHDVSINADSAMGREAHLKNLFIDNIFFNLSHGPPLSRICRQGTTAQAFVWMLQVDFK